MASGYDQNYNKEYYQSSPPRNFERYDSNDLGARSPPQSQRSRPQSSRNMNDSRDFQDYKFEQSQKSKGGFSQANSSRGTGSRPAKVLQNVEKKKLLDEMNNKVKV